MANLTSNARTKFYIGTTAAAAAGDTYVRINGVTDFETYGDKSEVVSEKIIGEGRVLKSRGTRDAGSFALTVALDEDDAGQEAMRDAESDDDGQYNFKIELENGKVRYLRGFVSSYEETPGGADANVKAKFTIELNSKPVLAAAA
jgi:hypothetical protein